MNKKIPRLLAAGLLGLALTVGSALPASAHAVGRTWVGWDGLYRIQYTVGAYVGAGPAGPCDTHRVTRRIIFAPPWDWRTYLPPVNKTIC